MYIYKNTKSTFTGWTIPADCVEITDEQYQKLLNNELEWRDGALVPHIKSIAEINEEKISADRKAYKIELNEILKWLSENDWIINKIILGEWPTNDERWINYLNERKIKRARHDELVKLLG